MYFGRSSFKSFFLRPSSGFTLIEVLVVVSVLMVVIWVAVPTFSVGAVRAKSLQETQNLRSIEVAKSSYLVENSGVELIYQSQLEPYFPSGKLPVSPWGVAYEHVLDVTRVVESQANGDPRMEPSVQPLDANGFNDLASPGLVYAARASVPSDLNFTLGELELSAAIDLSHPSPRKGYYLDKDNGHGNDPSKYDESNPGKSKD